MVRHEQSGYVLPPGDNDALGDVLETLVSDSKHRQELGAAGRADAALRFDARQNARQLFDFVRSRC